MIQSDALSRRLDHVPDHDENDKEVTMLPEQMFVNLIDTELQGELLAKLAKDKLAKDILEILKQGPSQATKDLEDWTMDENNQQQVLFYQDKQYVPADLELR